MSEILCLKVCTAKTAKNGIYRFGFPWDRVYLSRNIDMPKMSKVFRYYMSMPVDKQVFDILNCLVIDGGVNSVPIKRDDTKTKNRKYVKETNVFEKLGVTGNEDWTMIIPTSLKTIKQNAEDGESLEKSTIRYFVTKNLYAHANVKLQWPSITLHTPYKEIHLMCATCKNILKYHSGECNPGTKNCRESAEVTFDRDLYFKEMEDASSVPQD